MSTAKLYTHVQSKLQQTLPSLRASNCEVLAKHVFKDVQRYDNVQTQRSVVCTALAQIRRNRTALQASIEEGRLDCSHFDSVRLRPSKRKIEEIEQLEEERRETERQWTVKEDGAFECPECHRKFTRTQMASGTRMGSSKTGVLVGICENPKTHCNLFTPSHRLE